MKKNEQNKKQSWVLGKKMNLLEKKQAKEKENNGNGKLVKKDVWRNYSEHCRSFVTTVLLLLLLNILLPCLGPQPRTLPALEKN
jgi:hypothetical protein